MNRTRLLQAPVITLLSPSLDASTKAVRLLSALGKMHPILDPNLDKSTASSIMNDDILNQTFMSSISRRSQTWTSLGVVCPVSNSIIHFCSFGRSDEQTKVTEKKQPFALLSITDTPETNSSAKGINLKETAQESMLYSRNLLASQIQARSSTKRFWTNIKSMFGSDMAPHEILDSISSCGLPLLSIPSDIGDEKKNIPTEVNTYLKEIVIPFFDYAEYKDGSTLLSKLSQTEMKRPAVGVYQWPNAHTYIRPLPTAGADRRLPPPSFIFHCSSQDIDTSISGICEQNGIRQARIGYGGLGDGQTMLLHEDLFGLDIRYCSKTKVSSAFSEAQESLLAASIDELQSTNILLAKGEEGKDDVRINKGDCWVEVRANLKEPTGYWNTISFKNGTKQKIAKIPDLPYE